MKLSSFIEEMIFDATLPGVTAHHLDILGSHAGFLSIIKL